MSEYDDSRMLSKILERMAAQSLHLKDKIDSGLEIPSWAEYKLYNAYSGLGSALGTAYPGTYGAQKIAEAATATKTDPAKWEAAKREAKSRMGGKHSARAMQLATQIYKKKGGGYSGAKPTSQNNSLKKWTKQKWGYSGKDKPGQGGSGVYLPEKKRQRLKSTAEGRKRLASASRKKSEATRKGQQYSSHGLAAGTSLKKSASASDNLRASLGAGAGATLGLVGGEMLSRARMLRNLPGGVDLAVALGLPLVGGALGARLASQSGGESKDVQRARARNAAAGAALGIPYILPAGMAVIASQGRIPESAMLAPIAIGSAIGGAAKGESYGSAKEAAASKDPRLAKAGVSGYNQAKRTPGHPTKSHIVVAKEGDKVKTIRFGQQGVRTNQTAGQREAFKSRHRKNISRGRMSAAYWADKAKWSPKKTKDKDNPKWIKGS